MRHSFYDTHTLHIAHIVLLTDKGKKSILDLSKRGKLKFNFGWADKKTKKKRAHYRKSRHESSRISQIQMSIE